jgi:hypothetical protein
MSHDVGQRSGVTVGDPAEEFQHVAVEPRQVPGDGVQWSDADVGFRLVGDVNHPPGPFAPGERDADACTHVDARAVGDEVVERAVEVRWRYVDDNARVCR